MKLLFSRTTLLDRFIILLLLVGVCVSLFMIGHKTAGHLLVVEQDGKILFSAPLDKERQISFQGPVGKTVVQIHNRKAFVQSSDCPRKICMSMGEIWRNGDVIACVPNHLLIRIEGEEKGDGKEYDIISR